MFEPPEFDPTSKAKLIAITFDEASIRRGSSNIEHEREVAIFDILEGNSFALDGRDDGPYALHLGVDSAASSLFGYGMSLAATKQGGEHWRGLGQLRRRSPTVSRHDARCSWPDRSSRGRSCGRPRRDGPPGCCRSLTRRW